jgi:hypothetical protein
MKTINLKEKSPSVAQLLAIARKKSVLLVSKDGATFVLEEADEFDREVAELGGSEKFIKFLNKRSKEPAVTSIEEFAKQSIQETHDNTLQPSSRARRKSKSQRNPRAARG